MWNFASMTTKQQMIEIIKNYDSSISERVLWAMKKVPRHKFCLEKDSGYLDTPLQIGYGQTISQPFIVAYMSHRLNLQPLHKVLEIGTGSGYQAAVLSELAHDIYSVERIEKLLKRTSKLLNKLGYNDIKLKVDNGYDGWEEHAPYDRIIVTAMAEYIPQSLIKQLKPYGKMIIPVRGKLVLISKMEDSFIEKELIGVRFVPLVTRESK